METNPELPKAYSPADYEDALSEKWEKSGFFTPENLPGKREEPYTIMMPPPNRTGTLHIGHAMFLTLQDLMIRFARMQGKRALWVPGTDHAAIATQVKVEQELIKKGIKDPRRELGREKFLEEVVAFAEASATTIRRQVRKMGSSCDWTREKYTLDGERSRAVNEMFLRMYEDGIIERGFRVVNWDPQFQTTLSDDEVGTKETTAKLLTFRYDKDFPIAISTTRPETKFGDTAVAVHPSDKRYKKFVGKTFEPVFAGKKLSIKVIADEAVDPEFGTGALGVTPAHAMIDAEMAERHGLPTIQVIGQDGRMLPEAGMELAGLAIEEAREKVEAMLRDAGLLEKVEEIPQNLPIAERGGAAVEQLPMRQWFVRVNKPFKLRQDTLGKWKKGETATLKELMRHTVESKQTNVVPERFEKIYFHWIDNLRDWCISRQIWFGHQIPVWYRGDDIKVAPESPGEGWERDPDTLDTWFSSGLWTFSALGWPNTSKDLALYHPTSVLETGYDILPFWVARMILMSAYALGEVPFKDVYFHGLVRDDQGRKMSKSLGNIIDPLDMIEKYGTDAVRLSLVLGTTPGNDIKLSEEKIAGFRNFTNKLWNIGRYVLSSSLHGGHGDVEPRTLADRWILSRLSDVTVNVTKHLQSYEFSAAGELLRDFTWGDFADWYLEIAKTQSKEETVPILRHVLSVLLRLWHPFMPFVTEALWGGLVGSSKEDDMLLVSEWPGVPDEAFGVQSFQVLQEAVSTIRNIRAEYKVPPKQTTGVSIVGASEEFAAERSWMEALARSTISFDAPDAPEDMARAVIGPMEIFVDLRGAVDVGKERERLLGERENLERHLARIEEKLKSDFVERAPPKLVEEEKRKRENVATELEKVTTQLESLTKDTV